MRSELIVAPYGTIFAKAGLNGAFGKSESLLYVGGIVESQDPLEAREARGCAGELLDLAIVPVVILTLDALGRARACWCFGRGLDLFDDGGRRTGLDDGRPGRSWGQTALWETSFDAVVAGKAAVAFLLSPKALDTAVLLAGSLGWLLIVGLPGAIVTVAVVEKAVGV